MPRELEPSGLPRLPADVREPEELERLRLAEPTRCAIPGGVPSELDQPRLLGVQLQTEFREPVAKVSPELLGVFPMLKAHHEVVSEPHDDNVTARVPSPPLVSPQVQDVAPVDVPEQRRSRCPLRNALIERRPRPIFNDPRGQPLLNQPQDPPIRDPVLQELQKPLMVEAGEVIAEISVEHPVHVLPHDPGSERIQRDAGRAQAETRMRTRESPSHRWRSAPQPAPAEGSCPPTRQPRDRKSPGEG